MWAFSSNVKWPRWPRVLMVVGFLSTVLQLCCLRRSSSSSASTFFRTIIPERYGAEGRTDRLHAWAEAVSVFIAAKGSIGWGTRTGGVVIAGKGQTICGVPFEGNTLRSREKFPDADFTATPAMVAVVGDGTKKNCKYELEQAAKGGWHQGQLFYYRLPVERPGLYTVRLTVVFFHDDQRRGDGITLGVDELMEVRLQCVASRGHVVVPVKKIGKDMSESMGVVEFHTVALGGEILLEAEGIYTCIGLSLIETFYLDEQQLQAPVVPGRHNKNEARIPHTMAAAELAPLRAVWDDGAGALCAEEYSSEATRRGSLQAVSPSSNTAQDQKYFDEWARRERLEDSAGRYCRPHRPPRWGEPGWTWADHSERVLRERAEATRNEEENKARRQEAADGHAKMFYEAAVEAAKKNGVSPGTAKILAAEAVEKALEDTNGQPLTLVQGKEAAMAAGRVAISLLNARGGRKKQQSNEPPVPE
ncbi:unnamed protein product, partial [Ectocarpus sp. 8 AP-2014]